MVKTGDAKSCIRSAKLLLGVLTAKGVRARPLTVHAKVLDPDATKALNATGFPADSNRWWEQDVPEGIKVLVGGPTSPEGLWPAHLVVVVPKVPKSGLSTVIDTSITESAQVAWQADSQVLLFQVADAELSSLFTVQVNGRRVIYKSFRDDQTFRTTEPWQDSDDLQIGINGVLGLL